MTHLLIGIFFIGRVPRILDIPMHLLARLGVAILEDALVKDVLKAVLMCVDFGEVPVLGLGIVLGRISVCLDPVSEESFHER